MCQLALDEQIVIFRKRHGHVMDISYFGGPTYHTRSWHHQRG